MKEIIFLSFGNNSNYVLSHFFNLNDELLKDKSNPLNLNHFSIFNDSYKPRSLLFDYSPNIQKYYLLNEKIDDSDLNEMKSKYDNQKLEVYQNDLPQNNFLSMMNELNLVDTNIEDDYDKNEEEEEEEEYNNYNRLNYMNYNKKNKKQKILEKNEIKPKKEMSEKLESLLNLNDNKLYEYFNFNKSIKNWNDYLQIKLPISCLNEIKAIDVDERMITSYIRGNDFFNIGYNKNNYFEEFEDSFRKKLEECDLLSCLHMNIDINSFWGGIGVYMLENINESINKIPKVLNSYDYNSSFYKKNYLNEEGNENIFDIEKFTNYIWFLSDLQDIEGCDILFNINYLNETKDIIRNYFGYNTPGGILNDKNNNNIYYNPSEKNRDIGTTNLDNIDPIYKYYYSALSSLQLQTFYIPLRSALYGKNGYIQNLNITSNENTINFMESDLIFNIDNINNKISPISSGTFYNPCRNISNPKFKWNNLFTTSMLLREYNSSILIGNNDKYKLMNESIPNYLNKMSKIVFNLNENYPIPISFPRKFNTKQKFEDGLFEYKKNIPLYINNRPYLDFCTKTLHNFKKDRKDYQLSAKKLLAKIDKDKENQYVDKTESIFNMIYVYQDLAEDKLNQFNDDESEEEPDI